MPATGADPRRQEAASWNQAGWSYSDTETSPWIWRNKYLVTDSIIISGSCFAIPYAENYVRTKTLIQAPNGLPDGERATCSPSLWNFETIEAKPLKKVQH